MKPLARPLAAALLLLLCFSRCANHRSDPTAIAEDFTIIPMEQYAIDSSTIKTGSEVSIIAYTGGKSGKDRKLYFGQFIVVDHTAGDTVRILSAMIAVDSTAGSSKEILTPAGQFDGQKGVLEAIYEAPTTDQGTMISLLSNSLEDNTDPEKVKASLSDTAAVKEFVLVNRNAEIFRRKYKTAKGVLRFHVQPWSE